MKIRHIPFLINQFYQCIYYLGPNLGFRYFKLILRAERDPNYAKHLSDYIKQQIAQKIPSIKDSDDTKAFLWFANHIDKLNENS